MRHGALQLKKMKKLKIEHLAPYLPYGLKLWNVGWSNPLVMNATGIGPEHLSIEDVEKYAKPLLRPLSDLTKEIEHNGEKFVPTVELGKIRRGIGIYRPINSDRPIELNIETEDYSQSIDLHEGYLVMQKLIGWHFDVFGLINKGLAIDINTIQEGETK